MNNILRFLAVVGFSLCLLTSQGCGPIDASAINQKAQIYINHQRYSAAEELLKQSLDANYENSASHYWLGYVYEKQSLIAKSLYEYGIAVKYEPNLDIAQRALIKGLHRNNQIDQSVEAARLMLKYRDKRADYFMNIGRDFISSQMETQAVLAYQAGAKAEPDNALPYLELADYFYQKPDNQTADEYLIKAFKAQPTYPGLARRLGKRGLKITMPEPPMITPPTELEKEISELYR